MGCAHLQSTYRTLQPMAATCNYIVGRSVGCRIDRSTVSCLANALSELEAKIYVLGGTGS